MDLKTQEINMLNDAMFKSIIRSEEARPLVNKLLYFLTNIEMEKLEGAIFMGGEIPKRNLKEKGKISDVLIKVDNCQLILELNQYDTRDIFDKNASYAFALSTVSTKVGERRKKVILINFDAFNRFKTDEPILKFLLQDKKGHIETELYSSIHILLENIPNTSYNIPKEIEAFLDFFKRYESIEELKGKYKRKGEFQSMVKKVEELTSDEEFVLYYDLEEKHKQEKESAYELGVERGLEQGSKQNSIEIAKKLKELDIPIDKIIASTGLSEEEIQGLD